MIKGKKRSSKKRSVKKSLAIGLSLVLALGSGIGEAAEVLDDGGQGGNAPEVEIGGSSGTSGLGNTGNGGSGGSGAGNGSSGDTGNASAQEGLLIEDDGMEIAINEGADLDELKEEEVRQEEERQAEMQVEPAEIFLEPANLDWLNTHLEQLTQMESPTGSDGELVIGQYIEEVMESYGYLISEQSFHEGFLNENGVDVPGINILAERGADAETRYQDILVISTHYDSKTAPQEGDPLANDKSGVAVLLEMARILSGIETDTDICFLFLSGEEDGLYGSESFMQGLDEEHRNRIVGQIHVEQVGYESGYSYVLKTIDGNENYMGNLVREEALLLEEAAGDVTDDITIVGGDGGDVSGTDQNAEETSGEDADTIANPEANSNWTYAADEETSQKYFSEAGIAAVTVSQDFSGRKAEEDAEAIPETQNIGENAEVTPETQNAEEDAEVTPEAQNAEEDAEITLETQNTEENAEVTPEAQNIGENAEVTQEMVNAAVNTELLQEITDILAAVAGRLMSGQTGSLL